MNKSQQFEKGYMCKKSEKNVNILWVVCDIFCVKKWVDFIKNIHVGKSISLFTFSPTLFQQAISTHKPLLFFIYSPVSTTPTITINYIKEKK